MKVLTVQDAPADTQISVSNGTQSSLQGQVREIPDDSASKGTDLLNVSDGAGGWGLTAWRGKYDNDYRGFYTQEGEVASINSAGFRGLGDPGNPKYIFPDTDGLPGQSLQTDGSSNVEWGNQPFAASVENISAAGTNTTSVLWAGVDGGDGNMSVSTVFVPTTTALINSMTCGGVVSPAGLGGVSMGIYDAAGVRLAYTPLVNASSTVLTVPFAIGGPLVLVAGQRYYFAIYSNRTGASFVAFTGVSVPGLRLAFSILNSGGVGGSVNGLVASLTPYWNSGVTTRLWLKAQA